MKLPHAIILCCFTVLANSEIADFCSYQKCKIGDNCRCSIATNPFDPSYESKLAPPQFIAITMNEAINKENYENYWKPLFFDRKNPDGSLIGLTFFVPHENTDYTLVQDLYLRGHEIGVYSVTNDQNTSYWVTAIQQDLVEEFGGQKTIISTFANIPVDDIKGARTPLLQLNGDLSINAFQASGFTYDNSWPTSDEVLPYTLNYASTQNCLSVPQCPEESHNNFWVVPVTTMTSDYNQPCNSIASCVTYDGADAIASLLFSQIWHTTFDSGAPVILRLDSSWFQSFKSGYEALRLLLDGLQGIEERKMFLVTVQDIVEWMKQPVSADDYRVPDRGGRSGECLNILCPLQNDQNQEKFMESCVPCPEVYPWKGNPLSKK